jgi:long-chain acyl-CoA synthetase
MSFLDDIFAQLEIGAPVLQEFRDGKLVSITGGELLELVTVAREFLIDRGLRRGDRCALLAQNSVRWVAMDLAIMAEGLIAVPLYARQSPAELIAMMKDCSPSMICCGDDSLRQAIVDRWDGAPPLCVFDEVFAAPAPASGEKPRVFDAEPVTIIYTSGTSGEAKGVVLNAANIEHMLSCTSGRLDLLLGRHAGEDRVFHYLPFCFAGSWILLLTCLRRRSLLTLNSDLNAISAEMRAAAPDYFLNVPALLERMRRAVDEQLWHAGGIVQRIYHRAKCAWMRKHEKKSRSSDFLWLSLANTIVFPAIRKKMIGSQLKALICGSAPLNVDTQLYFSMLGIPVLQVYGLTETTAICTMDHPQKVEPGRVGPAIAEVEMKLGEHDEILVRGPNVFPGYWNRAQETAVVLRDGWFHSGDQGEVNTAGNWRIIGRIKNLIILGSGHNIAPEPIEEDLLRHMPGAQQVVLVGNGRGYLTAVITGEVAGEKVQLAMDVVNSHLPHYKQVRAWHVRPEAFSVENGLLTANGKLKRDAIAVRLNKEIEAMYSIKQAG